MPATLSDFIRAQRAAAQARTECVSVLCPRWVEDPRALEGGEEVVCGWELRKPDAPPEAPDDPRLLIVIGRWKLRLPVRVGPALYAGRQRQQIGAFGLDRLGPGTWLVDPIFSGSGAPGAPRVNIFFILRGVPEPAPFPVPAPFPIEVLPS